MDNTTMIRQKLMDSIFEVFERMFYIFLEPADKEGEMLHWRVSINFYGVFTGKLMAYFSQSLAKVMVRNMLSISQDTMDDNIVGDCLKEAVNMICGNFLHKIDPAVVFDLSLPALDMGDSLERPVSFSPPPAAIQLNFSADKGEWLTLLMATQEREVN